MPTKPDASVEAQSRAESRRGYASPTLQRGARLAAIAAGVGSLDGEAEG